MDSTDWLELQQLVRGSESALISGQLNEWQQADCTAFHVLASAIMDLNARLARLEPATNKLVANAPDGDWESSLVRG